MSLIKSKGEYSRIRLKRIQILQELRKTILDRAIFFYKFIRSPRSIGSVTPSSIFLAQAVIRPIDWSNIRAIVELGAGTGVFTGHIQRLKKPGCTGVIFEQDRELQHRLRQLYPHLHYGCDAEDVYPVLRQLGLCEVDCVLSGLPFANFPDSLTDRLLDEIVHSLKPGGLFIAFQYSLQLRNKLSKRFTKVDLCFVPLNIPPAFVYYCYK